MIGANICFLGSYGIYADNFESFAEGNGSISKYHRDKGIDTQQFHISIPPVKSLQLC